MGTPFIVTRRIAKAPTVRSSTRWSYSKARCIVGVSQAVTSLMQSYDPHLPTRVIYDCVPQLRVPAAGEVAAIRNRYAGKTLIAQIGQLDDAAKGQRQTLAAARRLELSRPDLRFLLIGDGPDELALKQEAAGLQNVTFVGRTDRIEAYYAATDVLVFPSRSEGLGSSILEAMSFGVPVVAAAVDGIPEIVRSGGNGLLFESDDIDALVRELELITAAAETREALGRRARATAAEFSAERMAVDYFDLYCQVLGTTSRSANGSSAPLGV